MRFNYTAFKQAYRRTRREFLALSAREQEVVISTQRVALHQARMARLTRAHYDRHPECVVVRGDHVVDVEQRCAPEWWQNPDLWRGYSRDECVSETEFEAIKSVLEQASAIVLPHYRAAQQQTPASDDHDNLLPLSRTLERHGQKIVFTIRDGRVISEIVPLHYQPERYGIEIYRPRLKMRGALELLRN